MRTKKQLSTLLQLNHRHVDLELIANRVTNTWYTTVDELKDDIERLTKSASFLKMDQGTTISLKQELLELLGANDLEKRR